MIRARSLEAETPEGANRAPEKDSLQHVCFLLKQTCCSRRALLGAAALAACAKSPPPPAVLTLTMTGGADQNPSISGQASPAAIRVIQLAATAKFERADVFALKDREKAELGEDDLGSEEFVLAPGETRTVTRELKKGAQFIGVIALFRDIDRARWRAIAPVAGSGPSKLTLKTAGTTISLAPG